MSQHITTIFGVEYPRGEKATCYALVSDGSAACITVRRAMDLQREGVPFVSLSPRLTPDSFETFFPPDFPLIGSRRS